MSPPTRPQDPYERGGAFYSEQLERRRPPERNGAGCFVPMVVLAILCVLAIVALLALAAPRPAETTAPVDVSGISSARLGGAPLAAAPPSVGVSDPARGAPLPVPVANSATGEPVPAPRYRGTATWYCSRTSACTRGYDPGDMVAAIDTDLGFARGDRITVRAFGRAVTVTIVDVCACAGERLVDLTRGAFARLANPALGVIPVTVELAAQGVPPAPATDVAP